MKVTNEKGVTLISLIITVVILLVLLLFTDLIIPDDVADKANEAEQYTSDLIADAQNTITNIQEGVPSIDETIEEDGTEDDGTNNSPLISAHVSNVDKTTATITAVGSDADGDVLQYTLIVDGQTYGPTATGLWNLTGLLDNMKYNYTVKVTDGKTMRATTGTFTTLRANFSPEIEYFEVEDLATNSFTIKIKATDKENYELTYKLYLYTDKWGTETSVATITAPAGEEVALTATAVKGNPLQANTQYWWYIGVLDGVNTIVSTERQEIKTLESSGETALREILWCEGYEAGVTKCKGNNYYEDCPGKAYVYLSHVVTETSDVWPNECCIGDLITIYICKECDMCYATNYCYSKNQISYTWGTSSHILECSECCNESFGFSCKHHFSVAHEYCSLCGFGCFDWECVYTHYCEDGYSCEHGFSVEL